MYSRAFPKSVTGVKIALMGLALVIAFAAVGCGSSDDLVVSEAGVLDEEGLRLIIRPDASYTIAELTAVGFKKNRQFGPETVPGSIDIWYGFFDQRDIEVRFYESHAAALEFGVEPAELIIARTAGQRDPLIPVVNLYPAYAVAGGTR